MSTVQRILAEKERGSVVTVSPEASVLEAARLMNHHRIGSVVVTIDGRLVGIFTERDVLQRVVAEQRDPASTAVAQVMTTYVACATPETTLNELRSVIREKRIRHIPVIAEGKVAGMVSIGDLNRAESEVQQQTIEYLERYMSVA